MRPPLKRAQVAPRLSDARPTARSGSPDAAAKDWAWVEREGPNQFRRGFYGDDWRPAATPSFADLLRDPNVREADVMALLERIAIGEGTNDATAARRGYRSGYDVTYDYGAYVPPGTRITEMTLDEIDALQAGMVKKGSPSSVVGKFQIRRETLMELRKKLGLKGDELYDGLLQERLGDALLRRRGLDAYRNGRLPAADFQDNLAREWSSVSEAKTGRSHYGQPTGTSTDEIQAAILGLQKR